MALSCDLPEARRAARVVHAFLHKHRCSSAEVMDCELALVEACNNAIEYAPPEARHLPIQVQAWCDHDQIEIKVTDHTPGFEWPRLKLPNAEAESGRGLFLIRKLMDHSEYRRGEGQNVLLLRKRRRYSN